MCTQTDAVQQSGVFLYVLSNVKYFNVQKEGDKNKEKSRKEIHFI